MRKTAAVGAIIVWSGLVLLLAIVVWQNPSRGETLIEVLRILISWPLVVGLMGFTAGIAFRQEISNFLNRLGTIRFPGGTEISSSPPQAEPKTKTEEEAKEETISLTPEQLQTIGTDMQKLQEKIVSGEREREGLLKAGSDLLAQKQRETVYWWFEFLSLFLVQGTQVVLRWFASQVEPVTKTFYDETWKAFIPETKQRETILMVLLYHQLVIQEGMTLRVSDAGRQFLTFIDAKKPQ